MSEIKRKRLSLKTKKSQFSENVLVNDDRADVDKKRKIDVKKDKKRQLDRIPEKSKTKGGTSVGASEPPTDDVICLSDEIESSVVVVPTYTRTSLLDVKDAQLRSLRESLLSLHRLQPKQRYTELPPFPQTEVLVNAADSSRETTPDTFLNYYTQEFSPLPQMCSACAKRKPLHYDNAGVLKSVLDGSCSDQPSFDSAIELKTDNDMTLETKNKKNVNSSESMGKNKKSPSKCYDSNETISHKDHLGRDKHVTTSTTVNTNLQQSFLTKDGHKKNSGAEKDRKYVKTEDRKTEENFSSQNSPQKTEITDNKQASISACPLCAMEFATGTSQLLIDGHIAACLASADDDVMW